MTEKLFETALGIESPRFVASIDFKAEARELCIRIDFTPGSRFAVPGRRFQRACAGIAETIGRSRFAQADGRSGARALERFPSQKIIEEMMVFYAELLDRR